MTVSFMSIFSFIFSLFNVNALLSVLKSRHSYAYSHPNGIQNGRITSWKTDHIFLQSTFLEAAFPIWRSVLRQLLGIYCKCFFSLVFKLFYTCAQCHLLVNIFTNRNKLILLQLLYRGICKHIPVQTRFKMDVSVAKKVVIFSRKRPILRLNSQGERRLSGNGFVDVLTI